MSLENAHGNAVLAYLQQHGKALGSPVLFETGGYALTTSGVSTALSEGLSEANIHNEAA
ncbi:MAG TPA: hypothetical protein VGO47_10825 [Chlamydiales bacterium]|nr:hypothetical protein [Chlamydiales bacterium]